MKSSFGVVSRQIFRAVRLKGFAIKAKCMSGLSKANTRGAIWWLFSTVSLFSMGHVNANDDFSLNPSISQQVGADFDDVLDILMEHVVNMEEAPPYFTQDLVELAEYYSRYPELVRLLRSLAHLSWDLRYVEATLNTRVAGNALVIDRLEIQIDTRWSVQHKFYRACKDKIAFCVVSPADAILHELLHAESILFDPEGFLADGGMSGMFYPFEHERKIIMGERRLYDIMTDRDSLPRPLRNEHTGKGLLAPCVTCLGSIESKGVGSRVINSDKISL